jgi:hypothetical protein
MVGARVLAKFLAYVAQREALTERGVPLPHPAVRSKTVIPAAPQPIGAMIAMEPAEPTQPAETTVETAPIPIPIPTAAVATGLTQPTPERAGNEQNHSNYLPE